MATEDGNPDTGIGLHEATLAISKLLGPDTDNQDEAEALDPEEGQVEEVDTDAEEYSEEDVETDDAEPTEEESDSEDSVQELPENLTVRVKVDGEELEVTLAELRNGYSRTADYTRKATALANERKSFQAEAEAIRNERAQYAQLLPILQQQIQQQAEAEPDWDTLYDEDPIEAARLERHWRKSREERTQKQAAIAAEQQRLAREQAAEQQRAMVALIEAERARLPDVIPEWKDQETMVKEAKELREWAVSQGLTEQEINSLSQASHIALVRKAMLYDRGRKNVEQAKQQPKKVAKIVRPGTSGTQAKPGSVDVKRASQRLARTGRISDAAALLDKLL
jgi:hypothetical protein